jgi:CelD/BcsL family acetyltransferase involved in cellulose biosynthesis
VSTLVVDVVAADARLPALAPEWAALWRRSTGVAPFQSPAWMLAWWSAFGTGRPVVACLRDGGRLAGMLPLYLLAEGHLQKLLPIGIGMSDYLDILIEPGLPEDAADILLRAGLRAGLGLGAGVCDLPDLPPGSVLRRLRAPVGWRAAWQPGEACPVLLIPDGACCCENAIPARQRRKLRMNRNRAARLGGWRVEIAAPGTVGPMLDTLLRLGADRWGDLDPAARQFHQAAAPGMLAAGLARLALLRVGGRVAACCYALGDGRRLMFYLIGFDPAFAPVSPGSLLIGAMIDAAIAEGCREVHFLRGEEAYKYAWGALDRHNAACRLVPSGGDGEALR